MREPDEHKIQDKQDHMLLERDRLELLPSWGIYPIGDCSLGTGSWKKLMRKLPGLNRSPILLFLHVSPFSYPWMGYLVFWVVLLKVLLA